MNNYLDKKTVYLCGPIKAASDDGIGWRDTVTPRLESMGINVLDPCKKSNNGKVGEIGEDKARFRQLIINEQWKTLKEDFWPVVRHDLYCVDHCDFMIVKYDTSVQTIGTVHEMVVAQFEKKVVLLKYDRAQLADFNPWLATFIKAHHFFAEWDDMFKYLEDVNKGVFDTSLWVI